jgi:hypothetical protein
MLNLATHLTNNNKAEKYMELPKLINNINERVVDDLKERLSSHSRISSPPLRSCKPADYQ